MKKICVIGSFNIDMSVKLDSFPRLGETVLLDSFDLFVGGGKGANQAVAAGRLGADVHMAGVLGGLFFGKEYLAVLAQNGVNYKMVEVLENEYPGIAYVAVNDSGNNLLFVYSGANMQVTPEYIDRHWPSIAECDIFLLQQEIPQQTNLHIMRRLRRLPGRTIIPRACGRLYIGISVACGHHNSQRSGTFNDYRHGIAKRSGLPRGVRKAARRRCENCNC